MALTEEDLINRIDLALRAHPLPPERLLRHIIKELQRARGIETDEYDVDNLGGMGARPSWQDDDDYSSCRGSSRGSCSSLDRDSLSTSSFARSAVSSTGSVRAEHTSLPLGNRTDHVQARYAAQYDRQLKVPPNRHEEMVRDLQDKMQVKYPHADLLEAAQYPRAEDRALAALEQLQMDGGDAGPEEKAAAAKNRPTQIGGYQTAAKSMLADVGRENKGLLKEMASRQAKVPAYRVNDASEYLGQEWKY